MSYFSGGTELLLDRPNRALGVGITATCLESKWLGPASRKLRQIARNRLTYRIRELRHRGANWDGYGSLGANADSVFEAIDSLDTMIELGAQAGINWVDPHIGLNEEGHVIFEWWNGARKLTIYLVPGAHEYVSSRPCKTSATRMTASFLG